MAETNIPLIGTITVTACFGEVNKSLWSDYHKGIDLIGNTAVYSPCEGVIRVINNDPDGWGNYISIGDTDGIHRHILCHLKAGSIKVKVGQKVTRSTIVATMGATGHATGVHLHYQINRVINGVQTPIDPCIWMGIPNKLGSYVSQNYPAKTWSQINSTNAPVDGYKTKYEEEVAAHNATKASLKSAQAEAGTLKNDLKITNNKIIAAKAALQ